MARVAARWFLLSIAVLVSSAAASDPSAEELMGGGHWKRLRAVIEPRVKANPNDAQGTFLLSNVRQAYNDIDGAFALAEKAVALDAKNADYRCQLAETYGQRAEKASFFSQPGLARKFKKEAEAAIAMDARNIDCRLGLMEFHLRAPGIIGGDKKIAGVMLEEIMRIDPPRGYLAKIRYAQIAKQNIPFEPLYLKALEANPASYSVQISVANFYGTDAQKKYDLVEKHAREALKIDPGRAGAYSLLAFVTAMQKRWQDLDTIIAQGEKNVWDNLAPYYQAGRVLLTEGQDFPRAERYFKKYLTQEPEPTAPTHAHAWWRLCNLYEKMGRKSEAISACEQALRLKPDLEEAKKDLKRLK